jgi:hypothetical protein
MAVSEHSHRDGAPAVASRAVAVDTADTTPSALAIAQVVVRNAVPVAGILFFGWHAFNVLALYLLDTLMMIAALCAGVARAFTAVDTESLAGRANTEFGLIAAGVFIAGFMAIPLGVPLIFMANGDFATMKATFTDRGFYIGAAIQAAMALMFYIDIRRAIAAGATPDSLRLKRRFALIFLRWIAVLMVAYFGIGQLFGHYAPFLFVIVYVVASIVAELAPDRFLRAMPGGDIDAEGATAAVSRRPKR